MVEADVAHRVNNMISVGAVVAMVVSYSFDTWPLHALPQAALSQYMATQCSATSLAAKQSGVFSMHGIFMHCHKPSYETERHA
mmetsp:Transcript_14892/g.47789  ORF Transcript_14892/g.47789 Transcript_14892/m.47789 type:complete len:83 (+) Transcript_14892:44-292(+)